MKPLITVIVPIYEVEKYLRRCLDSIIKQTYKNLQIILVDDGSPDRCGEICDEYSYHDKRVITIHKKNGGVADARNRGLDAVNGDLISFIDADDYIHPKYIEKLWQLLISHSSDITMCLSLKVFSGEYTKKVSKAKEIKVYSKVELLDALFGIFRWDVESPWCKLYKKELFNGIRYPKGKIAEDMFIIHRILHRSDKLVLTTEQLYYHMKRDDSISGKPYSIKRLDELDALADRTSYFLKCGLTDLYNKSVYAYLNEIIQAYHKLIKSKNYDIATLKSLKKRFRDEFMRLGMPQKINFKEKLNIYTFYINPLLNQTCKELSRYV